MCNASEKRLCNNDRLFPHIPALLYGTLCLFFFALSCDWCFIIHSQLTLTFVCLAELDESPAGQSPTVAAVRQREEVGADLRPGGSLWLLNDQTCKRKQINSAQVDKLHGLVCPGASFAITGSESTKRFWSNPGLGLPPHTHRIHARLPCLYPVSLSGSPLAALASLVKWVKWHSGARSSVSPSEELSLVTGGAK